MLFGGFGGVFSRAATLPRSTAAPLYDRTYRRPSWGRIMTKAGYKERRREAFKLHLQDEHLIAIAHVAIRAAMLDKLIDATAAQITRQYPPIIRGALEEFTVPQNLKLIKEDLAERMPEYRHAIAEFISAVDSARYERNDIIHGIWRPTDTPDTHAIVEILDGAEKEKRRVTAQSMMGLATRLLDLTLELADWKMCFNAMVHRLAASLPGIPSRPIQPPNPPRRSLKDRP
jgi:hypothetical protein